MTTDEYYRERKKILIRKVPCFLSSKSSRLTLSLLCEVTNAYVPQRVQSCMNFRKRIDVRGPPQFRNQNPAHQVTFLSHCRKTKKSRMTSTKGPRRRRGLVEEVGKQAAGGEGGAMMSRVTYYFPINLIWDVVKTRFLDGRASGSESGEYKKEPKEGRWPKRRMQLTLFPVKGVVLFRLQNSCIMKVGRDKILANELSPLVVCLCT